MKNDILIISATMMEIAPLLNCSLVQSEIISESGRTIIHAEHKSQPFNIMITGPGTVNAAQALTSEIEHHRPGIIVQTGIAGIFKETGLKIGDIAIAKSERYIHTGIEPDKSSLDLAPLPFELILDHPLTKKGIFPVHTGLADLSLKILSDNFSTKKIHVAKCPFITVSTITTSNNTAQKLFSIFSPCMENMEGSGAAQVAAIYRIPFLEIRAGSNYAGKRDTSMWNIPLATERASLAAAALLEKGSDILSELYGNSA